MESYLVALSGPLKGRRLALSDVGEWTLGRHRDNRVRIPEVAVSRHHAVLNRRDEGWHLRDLESRSGTFVNGRPVSEAELAAGDLVVIAGSTFLYSQGEDSGVKSPAVEPAASIADLDFDAETALHVAIDDSLYLRGARDAGAAVLEGETVLEGESRRTRALAALLAIGLSAEQERRLEPLATKLLERTLSAVPAQRAALVVLDGSGVDAATVIHLQAPSVRPRGSRMRISRTVLERVVDRRRALFWSRAGSEKPADETLSADSVVGQGVEALAALPVGREQVWAVLYLDVSRPGVLFEPEDRDLLLAIAAMGASVLDQALAIERLERENSRLREAELGHGLVGESAPMRRVYELLERVAATESTLLVLGESGTGKELVARAVHAASPRSKKPFVAINCATLSETLLESELFGHEKGAFTGAVARKPGKLEVAAGGTLFLDEVGELPLTLQARLLRVLQERTFERVGGTRPLRADVRLVAATNRDLEVAIREGRFREDLYYRLNVIKLTLPPLRERAGDVALLARHFASHHGSVIRGRPWMVSPEAQTLLTAYPWPGNVRELSNAVERAVVLGQDETIRPEDLPEPLLEGADEASAETVPKYHEALNRLKRQLVAEAVSANSGNVTRAAKQLGLHPNHLHRLITSLGLRKESG